MLLEPRRPPSLPSTSSWPTLATPPCSLSESLPLFLPLPAEQKKKKNKAEKTHSRNSRRRRPGPLRRPCRRRLRAGLPALRARHRVAAVRRRGVGRRGEGARRSRARGGEAERKRVTRRTRRSPAHAAAALAEDSSSCASSSLVLPCSARRWPATHGRGPRRGSWPPRPRGRPRRPRGAGATRDRRSAAPDDDETDDNSCDCFPCFLRRAPPFRSLPRPNSSSRKTAEVAAAADAEEEE